MSKPNYVCECHESFDCDTGASDGHIQCFPCAAWAGHCDCVCDCGQCQYTNEPCGQPPSEEPCEFCVLRKSWQAEDAKDLSEVSPMISAVKLKITQHKHDLATATLPGTYSHEYLQRKLEMRLEPCLSVLEMVDGKSAWASSVIREVKEVLRLEDYQEGRPYCGLNGCTCHLARLNELKQEKMSPEIKALNEKIAATTAERHLRREIVEKCWDALDKVRFQKRIADEMVCEHECETDISTEDYDEELEKLNKALQLKRDEQEAAEAAYAAALAAANESWAKFRLLMSQV